MELLYCVMCPQDCNDLWYQRNFVIQYLMLSIPFPTLARERLSGWLLVILCGLESTKMSDSGLVLACSVSVLRCIAILAHLLALSQLLTHVSTTCMLTLWDRCLHHKDIPTCSHVLTGLHAGQKLSLFRISLQKQWLRHSLPLG